ncbi:MAG: tRNA (adenosine(37)-N6)-threonylcarbamoyltransferase complex ATPase subunit type 1 TsaE [bacterium]|nr:tRNA (adenosine(37)-N6)-threonylcarbamoyltransferase complex ATPase subunit type 1 TsaE [Gammaproteobacteria bacterium]HIL94750.1 tRNA (adenosine(37)-N6)-threonylcarbamoyltransferase complex ATPase subunit type 1 TsaE [Pseudomonadales bacterium]
MTFEIYLADENATLEIASRLSKLLDGRGVVFLEGQLGAGKTTFCRGMLRAMGYSGAVKSPTFTLVEPYNLQKGHVYHFDLYRLNDPEELEYLGIDDYLDANELCLVEWPERGQGFLPDCDLSIQLTVKLTEGMGRRLRVEGKSARGHEICQTLTDCDGR